MSRRTFTVEKKRGLKNFFWRQYLCSFYDNLYKNAFRRTSVQENLYFWGVRFVSTFELYNKANWLCIHEFDLVLPAYFLNWCHQWMDPQKKVMMSWGNLQRKRPIHWRSFSLLISWAVTSTIIVTWTGLHWCSEGKFVPLSPALCPCPGNRGPAPATSRPNHPAILLYPTSNSCMSTTVLSFRSLLTDIRNSSWRFWVSVLPGDTFRCDFL